MTKLALLAFLLLSGCATIPTTAHVPQIAETIALDACHPGQVEIFLNRDWALASGGLINVVTRSRYSHTGFVLCDGTFLDASPFGVRIRKASPAKRVLIKADAQKVLGWALRQRGRSYGWGTLLTYSTGSWGASLGGLGCSQFVAEAFARDRISFGPKPAKVSPATIARWIRSRT